MVWGLPIVSIVVLFLGIPYKILEIYLAKPKKRELQWRLQVGFRLQGLGRGGFRDCLQPLPWHAALVCGRLRV